MQNSTQQQQEPKKRGRKPKQQTNNQQETLKVSEVESRWKKFFNSYGQELQSQFFLLNQGQFFTNDPYLLNQRIKSLKTLPSFQDREKIEQALLSPEYNELLIRQSTRSMLYTTYPLYRLMMLYEGILKYRNYIQPLYVNKEELTKPRFKNEWKFIDVWNKKLNAKHSFRRIVGEVMAEGKKAYYLRQSYQTDRENVSVDYVHFQELPSDWYKIIKHSTDQYEVVAFNFAYFWQAGTDIGQFPPIFGKYYQELMNATEVQSGRKVINPIKTAKDAVVEYNEETMTWFYWKELPADECFVFCFTETDDLQISPFCSLLLQAQDLAQYSLLQQQLLTIPLYSILLGELPTHDNNKGGTTVDDYKLQPEQVRLFEEKVNSQMPPGTTYAMVPSIKNQLYNFQEIPNANEIYNKGLQQLINTSGAQTLMTTTEKPSVAQVGAGKIIEVRYIDRIYDQFQNAVNITLEKMYDEGDLRYKWFFRIFGDSFSEKDEVEAVEKSLQLGQLELLPKYLQYHDMTLMDAIQSSEWVESSGIYDMFKPLVNTYSTNQQNQQSDSGRKKKEEDEVDNDSTAAQIDSGTNLIENRI